MEVRGGEAPAESYVIVISCRKMVYSLLTNAFVQLSIHRVGMGWFVRIRSICRRQCLACSSAGVTGGISHLVGSKESERLV